MTIEWLPIAGVALIRGERFEDARGDFRTLVDPAAFTELGLGSSPTKIASAHNRAAGTVRGLHLQIEPFSEHKTLWCSTGSLFDVLVDARPESETFGRWISVALDSGPLALHVPPGVAHGYQTLVDDCVVTYVIRGPHEPAAARTVRWDDPTLAIEWPLPVSAISDNDRQGEPWPPRL